MTQKGGVSESLLNTCTFRSTHCFFPPRRPGQPKNGDNARPREVENCLQCPPLINQCSFLCARRLASLALSLSTLSHLSHSIPSSSSSSFDNEVTTQKRAPTTLQETVLFVLHQLDLSEFRKQRCRRLHSVRKSCT
ncbi:hypothetical protein B9Z55_021946 [Caenorhabditis nigoni]|uniref:Uncharacterized protein n=1 Tax=Caenorhabditis nigoni TaxID=1611254 RepID=A0A2G5TU51_9PELO|nr:hypothetical protein B9Z55_021946 [Caenorhabditis nigoni]